LDSLAGNIFKKYQIITFYNE